MATAAKPATAEITTLLGRGAAFDGRLRFEGTVRIDGKFKGEVFSAGTLVIGEEAHVEAKIEVGEVIVRGTIVGDINAARSIEIQASGRVRGDLITPTLQIDKGAIFDGRATMESTAPTPPRAYERPASQPAAANPTPAKPTPIK
jgi:cytoskeletal protein CcmA (bactofilin family)